MGNNALFVNGEDGTSSSNLATNIMLENGHNVETEINNIKGAMVAKRNPLGKPSSVPRNADRLGGHDPDYYAKSEDLVNFLKWKEIGKTVGTAHIQLPNSYNEIIVDISHNDNFNYSVSLIKEQLKTEFKRYFEGYGISSNNSYCFINVSLNELYLGEFLENGVNVTNAVTVTVYYR